MGQKKKNNNKKANKGVSTPIIETREVTVVTPKTPTLVDRDRKLRDDAEKEAQQAMQVAFIKLMNEPEQTYNVDDGDQSFVTGDDAIKLKWKWSSGLDWNPSNMLLSNWMRVLAAGDYEGMMAEIDKTPEVELKVLLERRETLYNFSALFHVIKGASTTLDETGKQYNTRCKFVDRSKQPKHLQCAVKLIELGASVEARDMLGATPLFFCVMRYRNPVTLKIAKILLDNGADINAVNRLGETALLQPVMMKREDCVRLLMINGADPTITDHEGGRVQDMTVIDNEIKELLSVSRYAKEKGEEEMACQLCCQPSKSRCSACFVVRYCSKECQLAHWNKHKKMCKETKKKFSLVTLSDQPDGLKDKPKDNFVAKIEIVEASSEVVAVRHQELGFLGNIISSSVAVFEALQKLLKDNGGDKVFVQAVVDKDVNIKINTSETITGQDW